MCRIRPDDSRQASAHGTCIERRGTGAMSEPKHAGSGRSIQRADRRKTRFARQLGVTGVQMNTPKLPGETHWEEKDLRALVLKCQEFDLTLEAIENVPIHFYQKAMLGLPGRDEQIEHYRTHDSQCRQGRHPDSRLSLHAEFRLANRALLAGSRRRRLHQVRHGRRRQGRRAGWHSRIRRQEGRAADAIAIAG